MGLFLISCCRGACITPSFHGGETEGKGDGDGQVFCSLPRDLVWYHTISTYQESKLRKAAPLLFLSINSTHAICFKV